MPPAAAVVVFALGAILVGIALRSALRATILPRKDPGRLNSSITAAVRWVFSLLSRRASTYERRDRRMAMLGPSAVLATLAAWEILAVAGYTLMFLALTTRPLVSDIELSGSSVFTLGSTAPRGLGASLLAYSEAGVGLLVLTLLISYLPAMYSAFSRREAGVSLLEVRAGDPPRATAMIVRFHRIGETEARLAEMWRQWEAWFADIEETHQSFPVLAFFRSPLARRSWITAAGSILDAASLWVSAVRHEVDPDAQLCIRAGFLCLRRIADVFSIAYDPDPAPLAPISVARAEWDEAVAELESAGVPLVVDLDAAWRAWRGWRVNYDSVLLDLARLVEAPIAPWVSDRSPLSSGPRSISGGLYGRRARVPRRSSR
jgi:hypothetical protein